MQVSVTMRVLVKDWLPWGLPWGYHSYHEVAIVTMSVPVAKQSCYHPRADYYLPGGIQVTKRDRLPIKDQLPCG